MSSPCSWGPADVDLRQVYLTVEHLTCPCPFAGTFHGQGAEPEIQFINRDVVYLYSKGQRLRAALRKIWIA